jgi:hypothetical protein
VPLTAAPLCLVYRLAAGVAIFSGR